MSKKTAPTKKAAKKTAPRDTRRGKPATKKVVAKKVVAKKVVAKKVVAKKVAPKNVAPKKVAPKKVAPKRVAPKKVAPKPALRDTRKGKPAAVPAPAALRGATNPVKAHAWKDVSVTLDGDVHKVIFFDWATLSSGARDPSPTAKYQPSRNPFSWVEEFDEYIVGHWLDPVDEGDWEPIGVVGLGHASTTESFAEMNNRGFLAVVKGGGSFPAGTVLWLDGPRYEKDQPFIVGPHVDVLQITRR